MLLFTKGINSLELAFHTFLQKKADCLIVNKMKKYYNADSLVLQ